MIETKILSRAVAALLALGLLGGAVAQAQSYDNPNLPRSPYPLPRPTYQGPSDAEDLFFGDDRVRAPYEWRHWGDSREQGETFKWIFAPNGVAGDDRDPEPIRARRYCRSHPGQC